MNKIERIKELSAIFKEGKGGIGIMELCEVMEALDEILAVADAAEEYFTNDDREGLSPELFMKHYALRRALAAVYVHTADVEL